jgi:hypothetical protein
VPALRGIKARTLVRSWQIPQTDMGTTINPNIALSLTPPPAQTDPITSIGRLMNVRDVISQLALRQAQTQQAQQQAQNLQVEAAQKAQDLADQNTFQQAMNDPVINKQVHTGDFSALEGKMLGRNLDPIKSAYQTFAANQLAQGETKNALASQGMKQIIEGAMGLKTLTGPDGKPDIGLINEQLPGLVQRLTAVGAFRNAGITAQMPTAIQNPEQIDKFLANIGGLKAAADLALEQNKTKAETAQSTAAATESTAKAGETNLQAQLVQHQIDLYNALKASPQSLQSYVAKSIDPQKYPAEFQRAVNEAQNQPDIKGINDVVQKHSQLVGEQEKTIATESNRDVIGARVNQAVQTEIQKAALAPGALSGIIDPAARSQAQTAYTGALKDYAGKAGDAARLQAFVDAARSGNQSAAGMLPIAEVREIVNRVNTQELNAAGGGSLLRRVDNALSKATTGVPSAETLNEMEQLGHIAQQSAKTAYGTVAMGVNALGGKLPLEPPTLPGTANPAPSTSHGPVTHRYNPATGKIEPVTQ